ncbi:hypothetical protein, partial [Rhodococcus aetherivorans]|uniref:hypothetical protein n=1 Tax=Rhodococcus aetherivorans TaxID=191292 RepID=UPI001C3FF0C0
PEESRDDVVHHLQGLDRVRVVRSQRLAVEVAVGITEHRPTTPPARRTVDVSAQQPGALLLMRPTQTLLGRGLLPRRHQDARRALRLRSQIRIRPTRVNSMA